MGWQSRGEWRSSRQSSRQASKILVLEVQSSRPVSSQQSSRPGSRQVGQRTAKRSVAWEAVAQDGKKLEEEEGGLSCGPQLDPEVSELLKAVTDGRRKFTEGDTAGAAETLQKALWEHLPPTKLQALREQAALSQDSCLAMRRRIPPVLMPPAFQPKEVNPKPTLPTVDELIGQVLRLLCLCHSKQGDWNSVCECADAGLELKLVPLHGELRLELLLRRGVALCHLADMGPRKLANRRDLRRAELDLRQVLKHRPRDTTVLRCLEKLAFLRLQEATLADRLQEVPPLRGLAKLRAMDA